MKTITENRLFTPELEEALKNYPLYSQDDKQCDAVCNAVFSIGNIRWYILEGEKEGSDYTLFCIVVGMPVTEYGYVSLGELADISIDASSYGLGMVTVEQETDFKPCALSEIQDVELQRFLNRLYN